MTYSAVKPGLINGRAMLRVYIHIYTYIHTYVRIGWSRHRVFDREVYRNAKLTFSNFCPDVHQLQILFMSRRCRIEIRDGKLMLSATDYEHSNDPCKNCTRETFLPTLWHGCREMRASLTSLKKAILQPRRRDRGNDPV